MRARIFLFLAGFSLVSITIVYQGLSDIHVLLPTVLQQHGALTVPANLTVTDGHHHHHHPTIRKPRVLETSTIAVEQPIVLDKETVLASDSSIPPSKGPSLPTLVLHIGPHKTATSTIQCDLTHFKHELQENGNFVFLGRKACEVCPEGQPQEDQLAQKPLINKT